VWSISEKAHSEEINIQYARSVAAECLSALVSGRGGRAAAAVPEPGPGSSEFLPAMIKFRTIRCARAMVLSFDRGAEPRGGLPPGNRPTCPSVPSPPASARPSAPDRPARRHSEKPAAECSAAGRPTSRASGSATCPSAPAFGSVCHRACVRRASGRPLP
jgi:hypothetical protein